MSQENLHRRDPSEGVRKPLRLLLRPAQIDEQQKRHHERISTRRSVPVSADEIPQPVEARLVDLSVSGAKVQVQAELPETTAVEIEVLPGRIVSASIVWSKPEETATLLGVAWTDPLTIDDVWAIRANTNTESEDLP